ncbi:MAG: ParB/RepB/Spo0J family partition protein [Candidatus Sedimenticola sp. (ex Thyasira tokunagai)]
MSRLGKKAQDPEKKLDASTTTSKSEKWAGRAASPIIQETEARVAEGEAVDGRETHIPVNRIVVDTEQPRMKLHKLGITPETVIAHREGLLDLSSEDNPKRAEAFERLQGLAASMRKSKQLQAIIVFPQGDNFPIEVGERRYLSSLLNNWSSIRSLVKLPPESELILRITQLAENIARDDLDLSERFCGLQKIDLLHSQDTGNDLTTTDIGEMLGVGVRTAQRYMSLLHAPVDIKEAVREGQVRSLQRAVALTGMNPEERAEALINPESLTEKSGEDDIKKQQKEEKPISRGRKPTAVNMGKVGNPDVVHHIISKVIEKKRFAELFGDTDWSDLKSTKKAWDQFVTEVNTLLESK